MALNEKLVKKHLNALGKRVPSKGIPANVIVTLLTYSIGMITMPMTAYYLFMYLFGGSTVIGAAAAIITVHIILAGFVWKGIRQPAADIELKEE